MRCAILRGSNKLIVAHNHPSGDSKPSKVDIEFTNKLNMVSKLLGIELLDHIIIGEKNLSMQENHYFYENYNSANLENEAIMELKKKNSKLQKKIKILERNNELEDLEI